MRLGIALSDTSQYRAERSRHLWRGLRRLMRPAGHDEGFTLIEVIVALAILSIGLSVLLGLISGGLLQTASAERIAEAGSLAQSLMAEVGADLPIKPGEREGQFSSGYRWRLKMLQYGDAKEQEEWPVGLYVISTEINWEDGARQRSLELTTLRVGPRAARK
jgi:general secretion pathway protein I